jgi:hypothetical protein
VDATVVQIWPTKTRFATVCKYCEQQWFLNLTKKVLCVVTALFSHQIDDVESIDFPNNGQHEPLGPDLLLHVLRDIISRCAPFRRVMKFQSEPTLVHGHKSLKFIFLVGLENGQSLFASFHSNLSQIGRLLVRDPTEMKNFHNQQFPQMTQDS